MSDIQLNDPQTLYRRWEESQWTPLDVDLSADREQWPRSARPNAASSTSRCPR